MGLELRIDTQNRQVTDSNNEKIEIAKLFPEAFYSDVKLEMPSTTALILLKLSKTTLRRYVLLSVS